MICQGKEEKKDKKNPRSQLYHTEFSVQKIPTREK